jgi:glycosyltransferase involved in cell wall biosynthesis
MSESDIISLWSEPDDIKVSILCATFNQELYIEDALKGFLTQDTTFAFEIIVHDDASSDNTQQIIKKYQQLYPQIIKPILQSENQYSKGNFKPTAYMAKFSRGLYIALCEGDDYWTDKDKLTKQYELLKNHPNINLCVHDAKTIDAKGELSNYQFKYRGDSVHIVPFEQIFREFRQFAPTASMMIKSIILKNLPELFYRAPVGDFFLEALSGQNGVLYIPDKMSIYRREAKSSWSADVLKDISKEENHFLRMLSSLKDLEEYLPKDKAKYVKLKKVGIYEKLAFIYIRTNKKLHSAKYYFKFINCGDFTFRQLRKYITKFILG